MGQRDDLPEVREESIVVQFRGEEARCDDNIERLCVDLVDL